MLTYHFTKMTNTSIHQADLQQVRSLFSQILQEQADARPYEWARAQTEQLLQSFTERKLFLSFSSVARHCGAASPLADTRSWYIAKTLRKGLNIEQWSNHQLIRVLLLTTIPHEDRTAYLAILDKLFETGDVNELVAAYSALPLLPHPAELTYRGAEGIRTNMTVVLDAVTLANPYPADYFDQTAWNQLVMKGTFTERPIFQIIGGDARQNADLARILHDYAHERWAAGRPVSPELWRFTGQFLTVERLNDLQKLFEKGSELEKWAAALACRDSQLPEAHALAQQWPNWAEKAAQSNWDELGQAVADAKPKIAGTAYQQAGSGIATSTIRNDD